MCVCLCVCACACVFVCVCVCVYSCGVCGRVMSVSERVGLWEMYVCVGGEMRFW